MSKKFGYEFGHDSHPTHALLHLSFPTQIFCMNFLINWSGCCCFCPFDIFFWFALSLSCLFASISFFFVPLPFHLHSVLHFGTQNTHCLLALYVVWQLRLNLSFGLIPTAGTFRQSNAEEEVEGSAVAEGTAALKRRALLQWKRRAFLQWMERALLLWMRRVLNIAMEKPGTVATDKI